MSDRKAITITIAAEGEGPPLEIRARQFLKTALRQHKLRCTHAEYAKPAEAATPPALPQEVKP